MSEDTCVPVFADVSIPSETGLGSKLNSNLIPVSISILSVTVDRYSNRSFCNVRVLLSILGDAKALVVGSLQAQSLSSSKENSNSNASIDTLFAFECTLVSHTSTAFSSSDERSAM